MDIDKSYHQPELPFDQKPEQQPPIEIASGPPEFIANNPALLEAWERGNQRAEHILGDGKDEQQLPLPRSAQPEKSPEVFPPLDREKLRRVARLAVFNQLVKEGFISINPMSKASESVKPRAVLGSAAKMEHPPMSKEDLERGVPLKKDDNYGNQGRSRAGAAELKLADQILRKKDNRRR